MSLASLLGGASNASKGGDDPLSALFAKSGNSTHDAPLAGKPTLKLASSSKSTKLDVKGVRPPEEIIQAAKQAKRKNSDRASAAVSVSNSLPSSGKVKGGEAKGKKRQKLDKSAAEIKGKKNKSAVKARSAEDDAGSGQEEEESVLPQASDDSASDSDSDIDPSTLVHEADLGKGPDKRGKDKPSAAAAKKVARQDEHPAEREARTTFVGNVPVACATDKSQKKALVRHLISCLPQDLQDAIKMDTIRFRSLQLSAPVPLDSGARQNGSSAAGAKGDSSNDEELEASGSGSNHAKKRARRWKLREEGLDDAEAAKIAAAQEKQKFLTAAQKRKVAYIKGEVHEKAKSCNAYVVWATKGRPGQSLAAEHTASELAQAVVQHANNSTFEGHTLRVDAAAAPKNRSSAAAPTESGKVVPASTAEAIEAAVKAKKAAAEAQKILQEDEKRTLYIGGLDFEETEENVRALCERLMREERGEPTSSSSGAGAGKATSSWVERVRVIKDAETGLGKGFAYVLFKDRECVDEMLALDPVRAKLSKRKVRLERCNTTRAAAAAKAKLAAEERASAKAARQAAKEAALLSKGKEIARAQRALSSGSSGKGKTSRPDIGESMKDLPKEDRKALKISDEDRQARRLAKKQAGREKIKLEKAKEVLDKKLKATNRGGKVESRRSRLEGKDKGAKKTRVRSDKATSKKNSKKPEAA